MSSDSIYQNLVEEIWTVFHERPVPRQSFRTIEYEGFLFDKELRGIDRHDLTHDLVRRRKLDPGNWLSFMTDEGRMYYFPALMSLCIGSEEDYALTIPDSILGYLSPWPFHFAPHAWKDVLMIGRTSAQTIIDLYIRKVVEALVDPQESYRFGAAFVSELNSDERRVTKSFVRFLSSVRDMDALLTYHLEETLDGRIAVGDGYSWLPRHETVAIIGFIDFVLADYPDSVPKNRTQSLLGRRMDFAHQVGLREDQQRR